MNDVRDFVEFLLSSNALRFDREKGFTLKSGRISPYFINMGHFDDGYSLAKLAFFYAQKIRSLNLDFNVIFGPAYKGIPLATAVSVILCSEKNLKWSFDRKEVKDHGDGGMFVGHTPKKGDKILLIDDVITSGKAVGETLTKLKQIDGIEVVGLLTAVNRAEKGSGDDGLSAVQSVEKQYGFPVHSIASIYEILEAIRNFPTLTENSEDIAAAVKKYLLTYGVK